MRKLGKVLLIFVLMVGFAMTPVEAKTKLTVKHNIITMIQGSSYSLRIWKNNKKSAARLFKYKSSKKTIAKVSKSGVIKACKKGTAKITATLKSNKKKKIKITIKVLPKSTKTFYITPSSSPLNGNGLYFSTYSSNTKHTYLLRSYLEYFEKHKGCTLVLQKGTYNLSNVVYLPSYFTLRIQNGAMIKKINQTGVKGMTSSGGIFNSLAPSKANKKSVYKLYNGVRNVTIEGPKTGKAIIDMNCSNISDSKKRNYIPLCMCHTQNFTIKNLYFRNLNKGHFIEMDASYNVKVDNCTFENHRLPNEIDSVSECINLDTPDKNTHGFNQDWTSYDKTPNKKIKITNCTFKKVQRGVGTHQYSQTATQGKGVNIYHEDITIDKCKFYDCLNGGLGFVNWKGATITNNEFKGIGYDTNGNWNTGIDDEHKELIRALFIKGSSQLTIRNNTFKYVHETIRFAPQKNGNDKKGQYGYTLTKNDLTEEELQEIATNNMILGSNADGFADTSRIRYYADADPDTGSVSGYSYTDYYMNYEIPDTQQDDDPEPIDEPEPGNDPVVDGSNE